MAALDLSYCGLTATGVRYSGMFVTFSSLTDLLYVRERNWIRGSKV
jgi:hypothetical protein